MLLESESKQENANMFYDKLVLNSQLTNLVLVHQSS